MFSAQAIIHTLAEQWLTHKITLHSVNMYDHWLSSGLATYLEYVILSIVNIKNMFTFLQK